MAHRPKKSIAVAYLDVGQIALRKGKGTAALSQAKCGGADALKAVLSDNNKYPASGSNLGDGMRHIGHDITAGIWTGTGCRKPLFAVNGTTRTPLFRGVLF
ncbi:MAG: hypothetical protein MdMp014T_0435 [Treponematales bacterium]